MRSAVFCLATLSLASTLFAQSTANIVGTVRDSSGAAVPGARVAAINVQTGLRQARDSGPEGTYSLPLLPVGQYRVEVEKEGFQRFVQSGITLAVNDNATLDIVMSVGSLTESVTVTGRRRCWKPRPAPSAAWWTSSGSSTCRSTAGGLRSSWPSRPA